ncbi:hypothetical protein [Adlercreutzia sp. ZJ242]|uniref:hypothetical protein n=1 Tax=Adlercreutzia sp. ZJ242 TaxID=2709409 RepID=UPI0013EE3796|nr:hypothetical protein [Adlercreutzia sp. ZJ242]
MTPYFESMARQKRICPSCLVHLLRFEPTPLNQDAAVWRCDGCGWFQTVLAPKPAEAPRRARIIKADFGRGRP